VRKQVFGAGATLALLIAACGGSPATSTGSSSGGAASCVNPGAPHRAYVVVQHLSGKKVQRCVGFSGDTLDAVTLMKQSKIEYQAQTTREGVEVCQVDHEPARFSECFPAGQPYWSLWTEVAGRWIFSNVMFSNQMRLHDGQALGWHYVPLTEPSPAPPPKPTT